MKKGLITLLLSLLFCNTSFAESYYFKGCKLSNAVSGNYIINFDKNVIEVNLKAVDGTIQNYSDKIKIIEKNKIVSEKIKSAKGENIYYQYFLNSKKLFLNRLKWEDEENCRIFYKGFGQEFILNAEENPRIIDWATHLIKKYG